MKQRTDRVLDAIRDACERRRVSIDGDDGLRLIAVIVKLDASGDPREVLFRVESGGLLSKVPNRKAS